MRKQKMIRGRPSGFLSIRCEKCGNLKGFFSRDTLQYSRCKECDHKTFLNNLAPAILKCKCGNRTVVSTNMTDHIITVTCPFCRAPVDLELDRAGVRYLTMEEDYE
ncbi:MAG: hypothetical protein J6Q53_05050 [Oscillospiraceae bacterium]|nr:hypothetical protein [Oscillospiraceae bacterium]